MYEELCKCDFKKCIHSQECKRFVEYKKEGIKFQYVCPNHPVREYFWFTEIDKKEIIVSEEIKND